ncbi:TetR/AcrR family transcriptional regulator [Pseudonocardia sp. H11422]|uniref:SACE_7040 family transcriptional regulator n=1 Tax=Pseudonocardia sp. H11422 TaxID=2835866 RepID=UPI001BDD1552|nr:TetR/AcrR family transcriptional regulator [Pseudonocardia sp. H11422]
MAASPEIGTGTGPAGTPTRREQILTVAAQLFARHGFHGVSIADLGAAVGVSGPALYRHFPGKEALLAEMLIGISEHLLDGGQERAAASDDPREVLAALIDFQVDFALREPELIVVQDRDLANLPPEPRRRVRLLQRTYVEIWVDTLRRINPALSPEAARIAAHGAFGLLNSTPHSGTRGSRAEVAALLHRMTWAALTGLTPQDG